jgi:hypothetical protein
MKKSKFIKKVLESYDNTVFTTSEQVEVAIDLFTKLGMLPPPNNTDVVSSSIVYCYYSDELDGYSDRLSESNSSGKLCIKYSKLWSKE